MAQLLKAVDQKSSVVLGSFIINHLSPLNWVVRGDCDHHQRSPEDDERRPKNEVGHEDKAGCGVYPGRFGHGHGRRPQTHPAEGQGVSLSPTLVLVGLI